MSSLSGSDDGGEGQIRVLPAYKPFYWLFAAVGVVLFYYSMGYAKKYSTMAAFLLPPFICFCIVFDNVIMATTGIDRAKDSVQAMLAFHACVTPMILLVCYEIAYLVHKQKSVNFCGISFESGHRRHGHAGSSGSSNDGRRKFLSTFLRFSVWMIGVGLLVLNLLASYKWSGESEPEIRSIYDMEGDSTAHAIFSILPALVLVALSLYIGLQLWNYGTFYSYMVHATCFNPWIWMLVGSVSLLAGYLLPSPIYALSSNAGELVMMATIVRMFREVHHDMQQDQQMRTFIDPIQTNSPQQNHEHHSHNHHGMQSASDVVVGSHGKYELHSTMSSSTVRANGAGESYVEVVTPKESELRLTEADHHGQQSNFLSVVVASSRTNPLFSNST
ncbi:hypothetical protein Gpo141_00006411 [Globisporangium polare]